MHKKEPNQSVFPESIPTVFTLVNINIVDNQVDNVENPVENVQKSLRTGVHNLYTKYDATRLC